MGLLHFRLLTAVCFRCPPGGQIVPLTNKHISEIHKKFSRMHLFMSIFLRNRYQIPIPNWVFFEDNKKNTKHIEDMCRKLSSITSIFSENSEDVGIFTAQQLISAYYPVSKVLQDYRLQKLKY